MLSSATVVSLSSSVSWSNDARMTRGGRFASRPTRAVTPSLGTRPAGGHQPPGYQRRSPGSREGRSATSSLVDSLVRRFPAVTKLLLEAATDLIAPSRFPKPIAAGFVVPSSSAQHGRTVGATPDPSRSRIDAVGVEHVRPASRRGSGRLGSPCPLQTRNHRRADRADSGVGRRASGVGRRASGVGPDSGYGSSRAAVISFLLLWLLAIEPRTPSDSGSGQIGACADSNG
jgi:hypothetical protein